MSQSSTLFVGVAFPVFSSAWNSQCEACSLFQFTNKSKSVIVGMYLADDISVKRINFWFMYYEKITKYSYRTRCRLCSDHSWLPTDSDEIQVRALKKENPLSNTDKKGKNIFQCVGAIATHPIWMLFENWNLNDKTNESIQFLREKKTFEKEKKIISRGLWIHLSHLIFKWNV